MNELPHLNDIGPIAWNDIQNEWERGEERRAWKSHWKDRGYSSWEEWRAHRWNLLGCPEREWILYECTDPATAVPQWYGGPFASWQGRYEGETTKPFADLIHHPEVYGNDRIQGILKSLPPEMQLVGLLWQRKILIFEGMGRCSAMTLKAAANEQIESRVRIAIADISDITAERLDTIAKTQTKK